jgi:putative membrane protein
VSLLLRWAAGAGAIALAAWLLPGIHVEGGLVALLVVALIFGLVNALVRPLVRRLACALIVLTLGLIHFVINALMLLLTAYVSRLAGVGFRIDGFSDALIGAVVIGLASWLLSVMLVEPHRRRRSR